MSLTTIHRLGGTIELDERVSWCPPGTRSTQPVNCYLIRGEHGALLVDTGLRVHEAEILEGLGALLADGTRLSVLLTRTEMECCLNLPAIEERFGLDAVWYTGGITVPRSRAEARRVSVEPGTAQWVEPYPGLRIELISPLLRLLPTLWVHEPASGWLLTSDAFTHGDAAAADGLSKFRWFSLADTRPIAEHVRAVVDGRAVRAVAPGYGRPFAADEVAAATGAVAAEIERRGIA
ncbi:MBL fold metallo-hydrolase [Microbacterium sp.]|uniref:MBL fold metallo-hydrolase n=1 Tax=Microbacterium sp. TaxID=51671 RepID=UPI001ACD2422|nr:MBL fold metallo-hydrolase [Microbacterium sp.]MBN9157762.1 MBL fold metallo-hydrolase [Microbacterium sp.]